MTTTAGKCTAHIAETAGMQDHDRDLVRELDVCLNCLWRCDQYIANAEGHNEFVKFWESVKRQQRENIDRLRTLIRAEIENDCF